MSSLNVDRLLNIIIYIWVKYKGFLVEWEWELNENKKSIFFP